ncbi:hypothetical protein [Vibrio sp. MED222]|uniref:hypothetical protein n=1 Tax=Vibrio sp. MED222 TaxID=314290 RepID=UPI000068E5A2|nr:hypothetical protein [Vibrio sp. MED222]EAQ54289.1 hypothetical protein MED222_14365 [Vibrio sp. MED222]
MHVSNPFFNTQTKIADIDQLTDRLLALSNQDTQLISDVLDLTNKDTSLLKSIHQQATQITALKNDVSKAQYTAIASSENLLINPRGKINQANESDGVLTAGQYFCDGWKAGAGGAEVYRDADGFRLVSGSIVQLVPNIIDVGRTLRSNMDIVSGTPQIRINGGTDTATADSQQYIKFEVSGDGSKFTCLILAQSSSLPIYQQSVDELTPCKPFLQVYGGDGNSYPLILGSYGPANSYGSMTYEVEMFSKPALVIHSETSPSGSKHIGRKSLTVQVSINSGMALSNFTLDARP